MVVNIKNLESNKEEESQKNIPEDAPEDVKDLLKKNLELTEKIYQLTKKTNKYIFWQKIFGILKLLIIVVPIVLGILYLPPLMKDLWSQYQNILGIGQQVDPNNIDLENIQLPPHLQKLLEKK